MNNLLIIQRRISIILIVLIGLLIYLNSLKNSFVWDDILVVINNDFIKGFRLIKEIFLKPLYYLTNPDYLYYRPIQTLFYIFDYSLFSLNPFGFHLLNILLHICVAILIYYFINILFNDRELSFFTSLIFTVHPINTSVVNYISGRADILLTVFIISSLIFFLKASGFKHYLLSIFCFILAMLSKEIALIFPLFLIFTNEIYLKIKNKKVEFKEKIARFWYMVFLIIPIGYIFLRVKIMGLRTDILPPTNMNFSSVLLILSKITINYLKLIYFPFNLHMLRNIAIVQLKDNIIILYITSAILVVLSLLVISKLKKIIFYSLGLFLLWILPVGLISLKNPEYYLQGKAIMEEHWLYIPAIGMFILTVYIIRKINKPLGKKFYKIILLFFTVCLSFITFKENTYWKDNLTLFTHTLKFVNNSPTLYRNLGWIYLNKKDINKSIQMYQKALDINQDENFKAILYKDLAHAYFLNDQLEEASKLCLKATDINYRYADAHAYLGTVYLKNESQKDFAKKELKIALDIDPFNAIAFNNLVVLSKSDSDIRSYLIEKYNGLLNRYKHFDRYKIYRGLGIIYLYNGMTQEALFNIKKAKELNPYDVKINNALAIYYAESKNFTNAIKFFKIALKLNPYDLETYQNLAILYNQLNRCEEANRLIEKSELINIFK